MVLLVPLLQATKDGNRVLDSGLIDHHRLEPAFEGGVLLDVLAIFIERGGADAVQLAAGQHRLEQVAGVHRAFRLAGADDGVQLVDEEDDLPFGALHFLEDRFQPFLELAAELGTGDKRAHVEGDDLLFLQSLRHVAADDALGEAFDDGRLADAGLADEHGVVLGAAGEHLDDAANLLIAADDGVELVLPGHLREVPAELLQRLVGRLGILRRDVFTLASVLHGVLQFRARQSRLAEEPARRALVVRHRQQDVFGSDELVLEPRRLVSGAGEDSIQSPREIDLIRVGSGARDPRQSFHFAIGARLQVFRINTGSAQEVERSQPGLVHQDREEMLHINLLLALFLRQVASRGQRFLQTGRQLFEVHAMSQR